MRRPNKIAILLPAIIALIVAMLGTTYLMRPATYRYFVANPEDATARARKLAELRQNIDALLKMEAADTTQSAANDPDRYWPLDRTRLVLAINEYIEKNGRFPKTIGDLKPIPTTKEPISQFRLESSETGWKLYLAKQKIAEGN